MLDKKLQEIQSSIPKGLRNSVVSEQYVSPELKSMYEDASRNSNLSTEARHEIKKVLNSGILSKKEYVTDERKARELDKIMESRINEGIKKGYLPPREQMQKDKFIQELRKKYDQKR